MLVQNIRLARKNVSKARAYLSEDYLTCSLGRHIALVPQTRPARKHLAEGKNISLFCCNIGGDEKPFYNISTWLGHIETLEECKER